MPRAQSLHASPHSYAILGGGPAGLMAAEVLLSQGARVTLFEKRKSLGRKLLIAGSSGLNITNSAPIPEFARHYTPESGYWENLLKEFSPQDWRAWIERELEIPTFEGTSTRVFIEGMKSAKMLKLWIDRLLHRGLQLVLEEEWVGFSEGPQIDSVGLEFRSGHTHSFDAVCFALGGASYEPEEDPIRWLNGFQRAGVHTVEFSPSNVGFKVQWSDGFLRESEGKPFKGVEVTSKKGRKRGDLMVTCYGIEGTPIYFVGEVGEVSLDLAPHLTFEELQKRCLAVKENLSPLRRVQKKLKLCEAAQALLFHETAEEDRKSLDTLLRRVKSFPLVLREPQPLEEAISSKGGIAWDELALETQALKKWPRVFIAGEMWDWDAPTGGFLIQACVSQGVRAARAMLKL